MRVSDSYVIHLSQQRSARVIRPLGSGPLSSRRRPCPRCRQYFSRLGRKAHSRRWRPPKGMGPGTVGYFSCKHTGFWGTAVGFSRLRKTRQINNDVYAPHREERRKRGGVSGREICVGRALSGIVD